MNAKKLLSLLLALVLTFALVACSSGQKAETPATDSEKTNTDSNGSESTEVEAAEIVFWHAMNGKQDEALQALTKKFMEAYPQIKVDLQNQGNYGDLQQKLTATTASPNDLPTMTQAYPDWMVNPISENLVYDLTEVVKGIENYEDILEGFRNGTVINGKVYSLPFNKSTEVLWYNEDMFKELGLNVPTTLDELLEVSKKITEAKGIPALGFDSLSNFYTTFLNQEGVKFDDSFDPTSEVSVKAVNFYLDGVKAGYFRTAGTDKYMSGPFGNQQTAMYIGSNAGETYVLEGAAGKFQPKAAKSPFNATIQQGTDLFVFNNATDAQKKAAAVYMEFLTNTENQIQWGTSTGYIPVRTTSLQNDGYKNSGSLIAPILEEATKNLYTNPVLLGANQAYREAGTVLEGILADPANANVEEALKNFKSTLESTWN